MSDHKQRKPGLRLGADRELDELRAQLGAQKRIAALSRRFLSLDDDEFEDGLREALAAAAQEAGADRAVLSWVRSETDDELSLERHAWASSGIEPVPLDNGEDVPSFRWIGKRLLAGEVVSIPRVEALPDEARAERDTLLQHDNRSYLGIPIIWRDRFIGCLDVRCVRGPRSWSASEIERLQLIAEVLVSVLRRREAQLARRETADRFDAIAENLEVTLCELGLQGEILYTSRRITELLGYAPHEARELALAELIHPDDREDADCGLRGSGASFRLRHRDGSWRAVEALGRSYRARSGDERVMVLLRDVGEQLEKNALLAAQLELESLIADLSRRLLSTETDALDAMVHSGLAAVAEQSGADRAFLLSLPELRRNRPFFFEWRREGGSVSSTTPGEDDADRYRGFFTHLIRGEPICIPVVADMPDEFAAEREAMLGAGIRSYLLVPTVSRGSLIGILGVHCVSREQNWSEREIGLLRTVAELFTGALRRKRNETALGESEERFRALAENSQDPICELSPRGDVRYGSPAFAALTGVAPDTVDQISLFDLAHPEDRPLLSRLVTSAIAGRAEPATVFRLCPRSGGSRDVEVTARGYANAQGEAHVVAVLRDVSARERDRRALELQISGEQQIAELSRFFLDLEPGQTERAICAKLGVASELAAAERSWIVTFDPRSDGERRSATWSAPGTPASMPAPPRSERFGWAMQAFRQGRELHVVRVDSLPDEATNERSDLRQRGVRSFLGVPLRSGRHLLGIMGFEMLNEERQWSEEAITLLRLVGEIFVSALRREQAEIELERSQNQLLQSQKMEAVGTLAGGIAHDFNNHLAVMLGNARFVCDSLSTNDGELREALGDVQRSAEHCAQLTRSLLAFSRRSPVSIQPIETGEVLAAVAGLMRPLLPSSIAFAVQSERPEDSVRADPTQLRQVLVNLVVNARDALPAGGHIHLGSRRRVLVAREAWALGLAGPGDYVEIQVRDDGQGMSATTQARIFEPFFTTKKLGEGTGLGLATAYGIVQQCRGAIAVESAPGEGTTFRVLLPLSEPSATPTELPSSAEPLPGSETLLLVEDEPAVRRIVARTLRSRGYRVFEAEDGLSALEVAASLENEIDVLVSDLVMPRMGGVELAAKLQSSLPELRVLFVSGHAGPGDAAAERDVRNARFLQKPFDDDTLARELRTLLDRP
jgi:PAS domain S-box-containing protein